MKRLLILKAGTSIPDLVGSRGDFDTWIQKGLGCSPSRVGVTAIYRNQPIPSPKHVAGVIISGSHTPVPDRTSWAERTADWLQKAARHEVPILGICFGHQLLAHAFGGIVDDSSHGPEFGTIQIHLNQTGRIDPLFEGLSRTFTVQSAHYQVVTQLPEQAEILASSSHDPHAAFRIGSLIYGVQFHPEFDSQVSAFYIQEYGERIQSAGLDPAVLLKDLEETTAGKVILENFLELTRQ